MFDRIEFKGLRQSERFGYAADLPFFKNRRKLKFEPGLNVLFGPNGCGKSTVLKILGDTMLATQGGVSAVTETAIRNTVELPFGNKGAAKDKIGLRVVHDGQPTVFCDPRQEVGLVGGAFDDDFMRHGIIEATERHRRSHGQATASRVGAALDVLVGKQPLPKELVRKLNKASVNGAWAQALELAEERMKPSVEKGQGSILLDEPEANFSLKWQGMLWAMLADGRTAQRFQIIVASHSPFALRLPGAHYIDMVPGYREEVQGLLTAHFGAAKRPTSGEHA